MNLVCELIVHAIKMYIIDYNFNESNVFSTGTELQTFNTGKDPNFICFHYVDTPGK